MKKNTRSGIFFTLLFSFTAAIAQIPNAGFETWNNMGSYSNPDKWDNLNAMTSPMSVYTCQQGTPGSPGSSYLKLTSKTVTGMGVMPGVAVSGVIDMNTFKPKSGFAFTGQPLSLTGNWQYMAGGTDQGYVAVYLTKWNASNQKRDTIAVAIKPLGTGMVMSWTAFTINLGYKSMAVPDSAVIILSASGATPANNSMLYIDNLAFAGTTAGFNELKNTPTISLFPNPADNQVTVGVGNQNNALTKIELFDILGNTIRIMEIKNPASSYPLDLSGLSKGQYLVKMTSVEGVVVKKFLKN
jgi:hypothetical protein